ncbi:hypothetical protein JD292_09790 [Leucobacter sp. CSA2]|uniref:Uncharacterized protein n=1 Tax=Leucobacter edaphi TaxID=2796472 RepID=A0A934QEY1_9MICO|nr:hypothetical protein [Leucobacter edaphi]MBK0422364.1 hypothetical protein [Leucobacter edaphi]
MTMPEAGGEKDAGAVNEDAVQVPETQQDEHQPTVTSVEREVTVVRSVRYGRILIVGAVLGALIAIVASLLFPVLEGAEYTLGEVAGFMALIGAAIGLGLAGLFALILSIGARKRRGSAVAVQSDVQ